VSTGIGYDCHRFASGRRLVLGGVQVEHDRGLEGHSDADVLTHAIIDAMLGAAAAATLPRYGRVAVLAGIVVLTAASEKVSFTKVIQRTPPLHWLDMLGRRPVAGPAGSPAGSTGPAAHQPVVPGTTASPP